MTRAVAPLATVVSVRDATTVVPVIVRDATNDLSVERGVVFAKTRGRSAGIATTSSCVTLAGAHVVESMHERVPVQRWLD
jgi:hypothetical protein